MYFIKIWNENHDSGKIFASGCSCPRDNILHSFLIAWLVIVGDDIWRYVGKLTDAQKSMLDDRFKWKVSP